MDIPVSLSIVELKSYGKMKENKERRDIMSTLLKELKSKYFIGAILYTLFGVFLLFFPRTTTKTICFAFAIILILIGMGYIISYAAKDFMKSYYRYDLVIGLVCISVSIFIFIKVDIILGVIPILLGFIVLINSIVKLQRAVDLIRVHYPLGWLVLVLALLTGIFGVFLMADAFAATAMVMIIGVAFIWNGITDIITGICFLRKLKLLKQDLTAVDSHIIE